MSSQSRGPQQTRIVEQLPAGLSEGGDLVVHYLEQLGVDYIFGIPGGAIEPLYNAMARSERRGGLRSVVARHESGAAFMADGYARETGKLGVCCATTGPGATNLITGVACAYENEIPLLVITAQTALHTFGKGALQESSCTGVNTVGMFQYCTRYNTMVSHGEQLQRKLTNAILTAHRHPRGPAHLSIPLDVLRGPASYSYPTLNIATLIGGRVLQDEAAIENLFGELCAARRVVFVVGAGCGVAIGSIMELSVILNAAVVATPNGKGLVSPYHPQFCGIFGFAGHISARDALIDSCVDSVIAIGANLEEWASGGWDQDLLNSRLIHVDAAEDHFNSTPMARMHIAGDLATIFSRLAKRMRDNTQIPFGREPLSRANPISAIGSRADLARRLTLDDEEKFRDDSSPIKPQWLMRELARLFPLGTRFLSDSGNSTTWAIHYLLLFDRRIVGARQAHGGLFRACMDFAPMGWAIGAAVGTAAARPNTPVVCITGDGSFLMNGQEITVAIAEKLPVIFIILNDAALGMVKHGQRLACSEPTAYQLPAVDFCAMAKGMGADAYTIRTASDLSSLDIAAMCSRCGPTLLDVYIDGEEVPPMAARMKVLSSKV